RVLVADPHLAEGQHRAGDHRDPQRAHRSSSPRRLLRPAAPCMSPSSVAPWWTGLRRVGSSPARTATSAAASTGSPEGSDGVVTSATKAAATATAIASPLRSRGHSRAMNAAAAAASSPHAPGSATCCPASAPTSENRFQKTYTHAPAAQKPVRFSSSVVPPAASAADSSIVRWARTRPRIPPRGRDGARIRPYSVLRTPSRTEARAAPNADPPPATTPMNAHWLPPVNITVERTMACQTSSPAAAATAPTEMPYRPVASPIDRPVRRIVRRRSGTATAGEGSALRGPGEAVVMMLDTLRSPGTMPPSRPACDVRIWDHDRTYGTRLLAR